MNKQIWFSARRYFLTEQSNEKHTGVGYYDGSNLYVPFVSANNKPYIKVFDVSRINFNSKFDGWKGNVETYWTADDGEIKIQMWSICFGLTDEQKAADKNAETPSTSKKKK